MGRAGNSRSLMRRFRARRDRGSWVEPLFRPRLGDIRAPELHPVVETRRAVAPEFDLHRRQAVSPPVAGAARLHAFEAAVVGFDGRLQGGARIPAAAIAGLPKRRFGSAWGGRRNRRRFLRAWLRRRGRGIAPAAARPSNERGPPRAADRRVQAPSRSPCSCRRRGPAHPRSCTTPSARSAVRQSLPSPGPWLPDR